MPLSPLPPAHVEQLAKLLANDQLVLFVGAGISRQAQLSAGRGEKMPLWNDLAKGVASTCGEDLSNYSDNILDLFDAIESNHSRGELEEAVRVNIPDHRFSPAPVHACIARLPWNMVVSTNYDGLLQRAMGSGDVIKDDSQFDWLSRDGDRRPRLIQLHGSLNDPHTLTGRDYTNWPGKHPRAYSYLENIALQKTLLFVGYSFSDPHLKFGLLPWILKAMGGRGKRHYAWMWDVTPEQIKLFDKRDHIDALPITSDADWENAFLQLAAALPANSAAAAGRPQVRSAKPASTEGEAIVNG